MNKNFLEHYMKTKPETLEQKYLFLVDDQELAFAVIAAGYYAVALLPERDIFMTEVYFKNNQSLLADVCFCASIIKSNGGFEPLSKRS